MAFACVDRCSGPAFIHEHTVKMPSVRTLHRMSALALLLFLASHMLNHVAGVQGQSTHQSVMAVLRQFYRHPAIEPLLLGLFLWQALSGLHLVWRGWGRRSGFIAQFQAVTGTYLAVFLLVHVGAVMNGRFGGLDTDFRFAAAGLHVEPYQWFFMPYYFLAVFCLFGHAGCAIYWQAKSVSDASKRSILAGCMVAGTIFGAAIVASLSGLLYPVDIPVEYRNSFSQ